MSRLFCNGDVETCPVACAESRNTVVRNLVAENARLTRELEEARRHFEQAADLADQHRTERDTALSELATVKEQLSGYVRLFGDSLEIRADKDAELAMFHKIAEEIVPNQRERSSEQIIRAELAALKEKYEKLLEENEAVIGCVNHHVERSRNFQKDVIDRGAELATARTTIEGYAQELMAAYKDGWYGVALNRAEVAKSLAAHDAALTSPLEAREREREEKIVELIGFLETADNLFKENTRRTNSTDIDVVIWRKQLHAALSNAKQEAKDAEAK